MFRLLGLVVFLCFQNALADLQKAEQLFMTSYHPVGAPIGIVSEDTFMNLYQVWPEGPYRREANVLAAQKDSAESRKKLKALIFERYGLFENPKIAGLPLGMDINPETKTWVTSCLACHGGSVNGKVVFGQPNQKFDPVSYFEDIYAYRDQFGEADIVKDKTRLGGWIAKLGFSNLKKFFSYSSHGEEDWSWNRGQYEAWSNAEFGMLARQKDLDLGSFRLVTSFFNRFRKLGSRQRANVDPPAWWITGYKTRLYSDGFAPKTDRTPMLSATMTLDPGKTIRAQEEDYKTLVESFPEMKSPSYEEMFPGHIDHHLASQGRAVFENTCSRCHGTYENGRVEDYSTPVIPWSVVKTDATRLTTLDPWYPKRLAESWVAYDGNIPGGATFDMESKGFVAPPLKGVWATAPYFHNGSAPTLWDVLHPDSRPRVWTVVDSDNVKKTRPAWKVATYDSYDHQKMGLLVQRLAAMPEPLIAKDSNVEDLRFYRRLYFDGTEKTADDGSVVPVHYGKSTRGHDFPNVLTETEKTQVLEYLKTL